MKFWHFFVGLMVVGPTACLRQSPPFERHTNTNLTTVTLPIPNTTQTWRQQFDFQEYVVLDSSVVLGSISKVLANDTCWYVGDFKNTKDVYCFTRNGQLKWQCHLAQLETSGEVLDFDFDPIEGTLTALKGAHWYRFDHRGQLVASGDNPIRIGKIACLSEQRSLLLRPNRNGLVQNELGFIQSSGEFVSDPVTIGQVFANPMQGISNLNHTFRPDTLVYGEMLNDTIYHVCSAGVCPFAVIRYPNGQGLDKAALKGLKSDEGMARLISSGALAGADLIYETENTLHFVCLFEGRYRSFYYNKANREVSVIANTSDDLLGGHLGFIPYGTLSGDRYVYVLEPYTLFEPEKSGATQSPLALEIKSKVNRLSNPVLVVGQFKTVQNQQFAQDEKSSH